MFVALSDRGEGKVVGLACVADPIKSSTPEAIEQLHDEGIRIVMLTGETTVERRCQQTQDRRSDCWGVAQSES